MYGKIKEHLQHELAEIEAAGLYKRERIIASPQRAEIEVAGRKVLNFCANNYLGLSDNPRLIEAAKKAMDARGYGMSSVRFICGCQDIHKELEKVIADYFGTEDTILYAACFDANGGVFEPLFSEEDAIISDSLNHASIIDGVRLCKAVRYRYANADMGELEECLKKAQAQRFRIIVTDGVFSMDGNAAPLDRICALAEKYDALVMVDECHSAGVLGETGRGITELYDLRGQVDILTGTLGKAFGGAVGGFTTGRREIIDMLRQRSRTVELLNEPLSTLRLIKIDAETKEPIYGAVFNLYDAKNNLLGEYETNQDGIIEFPRELPEGRYKLKEIMSGITKEPSGVTPVNPVRKFRFWVTISSPIVPERVRLSVRFSRIPPPFSEKAPGKSTVKREICISFRFPSVPARITNGRNGYASLNV